MGAWILNRDVVSSLQSTTKVSPKDNRFSQNNRINMLDQSRRFLLSRRAKSKIRQLSKMLVSETALALEESCETIDHRY